jgi:hypothetical protein
MRRGEIVKMKQMVLLRRTKKHRHLRLYLRETSAVQFSEKLHFVPVVGLRKNFLDRSSRKLTKPIPFFSEESEFFPEPLVENALELVSELNLTDPIAQPSAEGEIVPDSSMVPQLT